MKQQHILPLLISLLFPLVCAAQDTIVPEETAVRETYGLRVGIDLVRPVRSLLEDEYRGFQVKGDYRLYENVYLAGEFGNERNLMAQDNVTATARGSYLKIGANYNVYENWQGMQNLIYVGLRYGLASFSTELQEYAIYTTSTYFGPDIRTEDQVFENLTASWIEMQLGLKVEVLNNVYLGGNVQLKRRITQTRPTNFDNLYIPGFNRTYDGSTFGVGYGYSISYLIPIFRK